MATYLLIVTPDAISTEDYFKAYLNLIGCNPAYEDVVWNGSMTSAQVQAGSLWATMIQMKDQAVRDNGSLTVVWAFDPLDELHDQHRFIYRQRRQEIVAYVDEWAAELDSRRTEDLDYDGHVCWILEGANTNLLADDFAMASRALFKLVPPPK